MADKIPVQLGDGSIGTVAPEDVQQVVDSGGKVVDQADVHAAKQQAKYGGAFAGPVAAGAAALRTGTLGLSDVAAVHAAKLFGAQDATRAFLKGTEEANPLSSTAGDLVGAAIPGLLTGGGSVAAEGAAGLGKSVLARGAQALAKEAAIGGAYSAGGAISEATLSNEDLTAEHLLAETAKGALFGAGVGALAHGAGAAIKALRRPSAAAIDSIASSAAGGEVEGVGARFTAPESGAATDLHAEGMPDVPHAATQGVAAHAMQDVADKAAGMPDKLARQFINAHAGTDEALRAELTNAWETRAKSFGKASKANDDAALALKDSLTRTERATRQVELASFGEAKIGQMGSKVDASLHKEASIAGQEALDNVHSTIDLLEQDAGAGGIKTPLNKFKQEGLKNYEKRLAKAMNAPEHRRASLIFNAMDQLKRDVGKLAQFGREDFQTSAGAREFDELYHSKLMPALENEATFGEAGLAQKEINEALSRRLQTSRDYRSSFFRQAGSDKGRPIYEADSGKLSSHVANIGKVSNLSQEELLDKQLTAQLDEQKVLDKHYTYTSDQRKALDEMKAQLEATRKTVAQHTKEARGRNFITDLRAKEQNEGYGGAVLGGVVGHAFGPAGSLVGSALGGLRTAWNSPAKTLERLAQAEELQQKGQKKISDLVGGVFRRQPGTKINPREFQDAIDDSVKRASETTSEETVNREAADVSNPAGVQERAAAHVEPFTQAAPNMSKNYLVKASAAAVFMSAKTPKPLVDPYSLTQKSDPKIYNANDVAKFNLYKEAVTDPNVVLHNMGKGSLQPEQVEAVKTVYPAMYQSMVTQMLAHIDEHQPDLDFAQKSQLGIFLGRPVDQAFDPAFIQQIQKMAMGQAAPPASGKPPKGNGSAKPQGAIKMTPGAAKMNTGDYETASEGASDFGEDDT